MILSLLMSLLPSGARIALMRMMGAQIGRGCRIGMFAVIDARRVVLGDNVLIAGFNLVHRLKNLEMEAGSRMNGFNWITGARTGSLRLGRNAAITRLHFLEASGDINIGANTIIAGRGSHFFTHGISSTNLDDVRSIKIGPWCYVGSTSRFVPGSGIAKGTFVGMGAVVTKYSGDEFVLIAGNPAVLKKRLSPADPYFDRDFLPHDHHPEGYCGIDASERGVRDGSN